MLKTARFDHQKIIMYPICYMKEQFPTSKLSGQKDAEEKKLREDALALVEQEQQIRARLKKEFPELLEQIEKLQVAESALGQVVYEVENAPTWLKEDRIAFVIGKVFDLIHFLTLSPYDRDYKANLAQWDRGRKEDVVKFKAMLGSRGQKKIEHTQAEYVQAEYDLRRASIQLELDRQVEFMTLFGELHRILREREKYEYKRKLENET